MRKAAVVLVLACVVVAALVLLLSKRGGSGGRGESPAPEAAREAPTLPAPAAPAAPEIPHWRAVGDVNAPRGTVEILLAFDFEERPIARGEVKEEAFAIDVPAVGDLAPALRNRAKLVARVDAPGFRPARSDEVALEGREPGEVRLDVKLDSGACVRGRVVDETGRPVARADVWLSPRSLNVLEASDAEGRFVLPVPEAAEAWLCARKGDTGVAARGPLRLSPLSDTDGGDLVLHGPGLLRGVAVYPDGTPARRLSLHAAPAALSESKIGSWPDAPFEVGKDGPPDGLAWGWTTTGDDGRFLIRGLKPGAYFFLEDKAREVFEAGSEVRVVVDLYRILVRIVDERGEPAAIDVGARSDSGSSTAGKVDDITVRPGERWTVRIGSRDLVPVSEVVEVTRERREYEVTLVARTATEFGRARVTLLDPRGQPFPEVRVRLDALPGDNVILLDAKLDAEGCTPDVPVGRYRLEAQPADRLAPYFPASAEVELRAGAVTPVQLTARGGGRVQLTFKREGGTPDEELTVRLAAHPGGGGEPTRLTRLLVRDSGAYTIGGWWKLGEKASGWQLLEPGQYEIHIDAEGYRPVVLPVLIREAETADLEVTLEPEPQAAR